MKKQLHSEIKERILILDGGLGTLIQQYGLTESDFRGELFAQWPVELKGCNDVLVLTRPDVIGEIHRRYLEAGADIITTDTFNSTRVALADYGLQDYSYEISRAGAALARQAADHFSRLDPARPRYVSGSVGPTNHTASIAADINNTALRSISFEELSAAYEVQIEGLMDGGADIIQLETFFDTLNAKAVIFAAETVFEKRGERLPMIVSGTLTQSGRTLSGQTVEAFYASVKHARPLAVGFNCSFGARQLMPYLKRLSGISAFAVSAYPNAGLPNLAGGYDETPAAMAADVEEYLRQGLVNIVGGCCGTTPEHIAAIAAIAAKYKPRQLPPATTKLVLSGLEPLTIDENSNFINIGERTNVAGSAAFARLIREGRWEEALAIARRQIESGANIIDICFDDGMIEGPGAMSHFLNMAAAEPDIARVPFMLDSSRWETLEAGLRCVQGKPVINSISLKEGADEFLHKASLIKRYGAAAVVMLFDEKGQADSYKRKIEVAARAYKLLTENGFPPEDIVFDPNVLAVATGMSEHDSYALDFIRAVRWIKENLPHVGISGGVSNLSFSFRGIDKVRRAMHSVFLYHAIQAGMNMGIVNPAMTVPYNEIEPELLELATDVVLNRRADAAERLAAYAERVKSEQAGAGGQAAKEDIAWRSQAVGQRIGHAILKGISDYIEEDAVEAYKTCGDPLAIIDGMFMPPMEKVGEMFGAGMMFLPQVVKSARVMKKGVGALTPYIEVESAATEDNAPASARQKAPETVGQSAGQKHEKTSGSRKKIVLATVKGDVHDIGKNIVSVVLSCNGYRIIDLGVMVECDTIVDTALREEADAIALSGLITPSLAEMINVLHELERRGSTIPVFVGGATTSPLHTAVKMAPEYSGAVIHSGDASENAALLGKLFGPAREEFLEDVRRRQAAIREAYLSSKAENWLRPLTEARRNRHVKLPEQIVGAAGTGIKVFRDYPIAEVERYIDWRYFLASWEIKGDYSRLLDSGDEGNRPLDSGNIENHSLNSADSKIEGQAFSDEKISQSPAFVDKAAGCADKGEEARKLLEDARRLLEKIKNEKLLSLNGVAGVFPATSSGDDIIVGHGKEMPLPIDECKGDTFHKVSGTAGHEDGRIVLPQLRNQSTAAAENLSLADYVVAENSVVVAEHTVVIAEHMANGVPQQGDAIAAPRSVGRRKCTVCGVVHGASETEGNETDYIAAFAVSAGIGLKELADGFRSEGDDYNAIMAKLLADRLTEAFAEVVHQYVRRSMWGFESGSPLTPEDTLAGKYQGLRMAFGYPAAPDHSLKREVFELLDVERNTGLKLGDNFMIEPGESLCGLIFADSNIRYFDIGRIDGQQLEDYACRRGMTVEQIHKLLPKNN